jgi:hypothetical protein
VWMQPVEVADLGMPHQVEAPPLHAGRIESAG